MSRKRVVAGSVLERNKWTLKHLSNCSQTSYFKKWMSRDFGQNVGYAVLQNGCANNQFVLHLTTKGKGTGTRVNGGCMKIPPIKKGFDFSDSLRPELFAWSDKHGNNWENCVVGDVKANEHDTSVANLGDIEAMAVDQARFDCLQGQWQKPTFLADLGTGSRANFIALSMAVKRKVFMLPASNGALPETGKGVRSIMDNQLPLAHCGNEKPSWQFHGDSYMFEQLALDPAMQLLNMHADVRGANNKAVTLDFAGYKIANLTLMEAPSYVGEAKEDRVDLMNDELSQAGLRRYAVLKDGTMVWEGTSAFTQAEIDWLNDPTSVKIYSRGFIVGNSAFMEGFDTSRLDYEYFPKTQSECAQSNLTVPYGIKKVQLTNESGQCSDGMAEVDYAVITVDMLHKPLTVCQPTCDGEVDTVFPTPMTGEVVEDKCVAPVPCPDATVIPVP